MISRRPTFWSISEKHPQVMGIPMYLETLRDGRRFLEVAQRVTRVKPVVVYKAGRTEGGSRAALSHTGAMTGRGEVYQGAFRSGQYRAISHNGTPSSPRSCIDPASADEGEPRSHRHHGRFLGSGPHGLPRGEGLMVPELSPAVQQRLRDLGMPERASTKNPVDMGATGFTHLAVESLVDMGRITLASGEVDALIFHGLGRAQWTGGALAKKSVSKWRKTFARLQRPPGRAGRPVINPDSGSHERS